MSCISAYLNSKAVLYNIDRTETTESGQPIETLTQSKNLRVFFQPYALRSSVYKLFNAGQVKVGDYFCLSVKPISLEPSSQVISIEISNYEKFLIVNAFPLRVGCLNVGYQLSLQRY